MALRGQLVNNYTYLFWLSAALFMLCMPAAAFFFYHHHGIDRLTAQTTLELVDYVHIVRVSVFFTLILPIHFIHVPITKFGEPSTSCYYARFQVQINRFVANDKPGFLTRIAICTTALCLYGVAQSFFVYYLYHHHLVLLSFIFELTAFVPLLYIVLYRCVKGNAYFYDIYNWDYFLLKWQPLQHGVASLQPSIWLPEYQHLPQLAAYFSRQIQSPFFIFVVLKLLVFLVAGVLFLLFFFLLMLLGSLWTVVRVFIIGSICCSESVQQIKLTMKRYGSFFDYVLFDVLFGLHLDAVFGVFLENEPTKYWLTNLSISFFHIRYSYFVGSSIPSYNLEYDRICYPTLYNFGHNTYSRILPSATDEYVQRLPAAEKVMQLFLRKEGGFQREDSMNLSLLFACYVRWFTHQFCSTKPDNPTTTNSPIGVNLSQLYGSSKQWECKTRSLKDGLLKTSVFHGKEFPAVNEQNFFVSEALPQPKHHDNDFYCIQILFFRHHQYIARSLKNAYPELNDEDLFQTAKLINILTVIKCTMGLYGELGLVQSNVSSRYDVTDLENIYNSWMYRLIGPTQKIFPQNSANVFIELNIMYRWHQLIPSEIKLVDVSEHLVKAVQSEQEEMEKKGLLIAVQSEEEHEEEEDKQQQQDVDDEDSDDDEAPPFGPSLVSRHSSAFAMRQSMSGDAVLKLPFLPSTRSLLMRKHGLERFLFSMSNTPVGKLTTFNTDPFLCRVAVLPTIEKTRLYKLRSFNDYRERFGFPRYESFEEFTDDEETLASLKKLYRCMDDVEFYVGIFAEQKVGRKTLHGPTLTALFASFVISFVTSSLLLRKPWKEMLTPLGKQMVNNTKHVKDLIRLHTDLNVQHLSFRVDDEAEH